MILEDDAKEILEENPFKLEWEHHFKIMEENQDRLILKFTKVNFQIRLLQIMMIVLFTTPFIITVLIIMTGDVLDPFTFWYFCGLCWGFTILLFIIGLFIPIIETLKVDKVKGITYLSGVFLSRKGKKSSEYMTKDIQGINIKRRKFLTTLDESSLRFLLVGKKKVLIWGPGKHEVVKTLKDILQRNIFPNEFS